MTIHEINEKIIIDECFKGDAEAYYAFKKSEEYELSMKSTEEAFKTFIEEHRKIEEENQKIALLNLIAYCMKGEEKWKLTL